MKKRWASDRKEIGIGLISEQFFLCQFLDRTILLQTFQIEILFIA